MARLVESARYKLLCSLLLKARQEKKMLQEELAKKLKRPRSFISKYENLLRRLDPIELIDIANALEVDYCEILKQVEQSFQGQNNP